jgi:hypothetical protein
VKCGGASCENSAVVEVFWPGKTLPMCKPCALRAERAASTLGFALTVRPLATPIGDTANPVSGTGYIDGSDSE